MFFQHGCSPFQELKELDNSFFMLTSPSNESRQTA
jgi:hypothetical protein